MVEKTPVEHRYMAQQAANATTPPRVLTQEDVLKFFIGLRLLGEKKQRYLAYMAKLLKETNEKEG